jgi:hypothetical protein
LHHDRASLSRERDLRRSGSSFNHRISPSEQRRWHFEAKSLRRFEIYRQLEFLGLTLSAMALSRVSSETISMVFSLLG